MRRVLTIAIASGSLALSAACSGGGGQSSSAADQSPATAELPDGFPVKLVPLPDGEVVGTFTGPDGWGITIEMRGDVFDVADEYEEQLKEKGFTVERLSENHSRQGDLVNWVGEHGAWGMTATISSKGKRPVVIDVTVSTSDKTELPSERVLEGEDDYEYNVGSELPRGFPTDVPLPVGQVVASATATVGGQTGWEIQVRPDGGAREAAEAYRVTLEAAGFAAAPLDPDDGTTSLAFIADNDAYTVEVFATDNGSQNELSVVVVPFGAGF